MSEKKEPKKKISPLPLVDNNANINVEEVVSPKEKNIILALNSLRNGGKCRTSFGLEHCARSVIVNQLKDFQVYKSVTPFDRRVTALTWHPKRPNFCAVGSKGGEIILWKYDKDEFEGIQVSLANFYDIFHSRLYKVLIKISKPSYF